MQTIRYRPAYSLAVCGGSALLAALAGAYVIRLAAAFSPSAVLPALLAGAVALSALVIFAAQLVRAVGPAGCFQVTPDGLAHLPVGVRIAGLRLPGSVRLLPWSCIADIRLECTGARRVLRIQTVDDAEFPRGYSHRVRQLLEREAAHDSYGFAVDLSHISGDPQAWTAQLQAMLAQWRAAR